MATRKIKDAKDLSTNELIYFKGHAKATYMSDGRNVEEAISQIGTGEGGGGITVETDPIFSASPAAAISEEKIAEWDNKYTKPSVGIPKSDLAEEVQNALRYAEQDRGTVTAIKVNGTNIGANNGVVDLGNLDTFSTYIADFTMASLKKGINNREQVECDMQALVAAMNANKIILVRESESSDYKGVYVLNGYAEDLLYFSIVDSYGDILRCEGIDYSSPYIDGRDLYFLHWWDKQDTLKSGENIKTINGESIVGEGNVNVGKITYFSEEDSIELSPGVVWMRRESVVNSVQITGFASNGKGYEEYAYHFYTGTIADGSAVKLILPDGVKYANKDMFDALESDTHYELSVVRSAGIVKAVLTAFN